MKRTLEVDVETLDQIVKDTIVDDYKNICKENYILSSKKINGTLTKGQQEDLEDTSKYVVAFETVLSYYMTQEDKNAVVYDAWSGFADDEDRYHYNDDIDDQSSDNNQSEQDERIQILEDKVFALELELARQKYNNNVDL